MGVQVADEELDAVTQIGGLVVGVFGGAIALLVLSVLLGMSGATFGALYRLVKRPSTVRGAQFVLSLVVLSASLLAIALATQFVCWLSGAATVSAFARTVAGWSLVGCVAAAPVHAWLDMRAPAVIPAGEAAPPADG